MEKFWELLAESVIFQGVILLVVVITVCYMEATGQGVPDYMIAAFFTIVGFFFGGKVPVAAEKAMKAAKKAK